MSKSKELPPIQSDADRLFEIDANVQKLAKPSDVPYVRGLLLGNPDLQSKPESFTP